MEFPASIEVLKNRIITAQNAAKTAKEEAARCEKEEKKNQEIANINQEIANILNALLNSWNDSDPGKYKDSFFFLDANHQRVVVQEFLPDGTKICRSQKEWDEYSRTRQYGADYDRVPYWYPVVKLSEVGTAQCAQCKSPQPIIEHYVQTYDSPDSDEWLKEYFVFCLDCNSKTVIESRTSDHRF